MLCFQFILALALKHILIISANFYLKQQLNTNLLNIFLFLNIFIFVVKLLLLFCRFRKPRKEDLLTPEYNRKFMIDQDNEDFSLHRGDDWEHPQRQAPKASSIHSKWSNWLKPASTATPDQRSLLEDMDMDEAEDGHAETVATAVWRL